MNQEEKLQQVLKEGIQKIEMVFAPLINGVNLQIKKIKEAGYDPANYYNLEEDNFINYIELRELYLSERDKAIEEFQIMLEKEVEKIESEEQTEIDPQWAEALFYLLKEVFQNRIKITIDDYEWNSDKPLDGLFEGLRDLVMISIGIHPNSDIGKIIKDPVGALGDLIENADEETGKVLTDVRVAADKALTDARTATDKALTDIRKETGIGLTNVREESEKVLTQARETMETAIEDVIDCFPKIRKKKIKIKLPKIRL